MKDVCNNPAHDSNSSMQTKRGGQASNCPSVQAGKCFNGMYII